MNSEVIQEVFVKVRHLGVEKCTDHMSRPMESLALNHYVKVWKITSMLEGFTLLLSKN